MANEAEQAIYQRLASAPLFHPASVELLPEDWGIETGDVVSVKSGDETYNVPVYSHTLVWNGKSKATIESTGNQEREPLPELRRKEYQQGHATYTGYKANKQEIDEHWQHVTQVTDKGMSDSFGIIGVKIGADGMPMKDASGNYIWDDTGTGGEIWGHLNRTAWSTQILNNIKDANGKIISLGEVTTDAYGNVIINAINDQRTGTATINANRIKLKATDSITLDARLAIEANTGFLLVTGSMSVQDDLRVSDTLRIGSSGASQGEETGTLYFQGSEYKAKQLILGNSSPFIASGKVLADSVSQTINLNHTHSVTMQEITTAGDPHEGNVQITMGGAVAESDSSRIDFFDIAASQTYLNGVAAARTQGRQDHTASSISAIVLSAGDAGQVVTKYPYVTYSNGDTSSSLALSVDATAISGGSANITVAAGDRYNTADVTFISESGGTTKWLANGMETTEIWQNAGADAEMRSATPGYYVFKVNSNGTDKWYGFWLGPRP